MPKVLRPYQLFGLLLSLTLSCSNTDNDKVSRSGEIVQVSTLGGSLNESASSVIATADGGFAILGHTQSKDGDVLDKSDENFDYWVLKFNQERQLEWSKTFGGSGNDRGSAMIQSTDGGYALLGFSSSNDGDVTENAGQLDFWLLKLDALGNLIWQNSFGFSGIDQGTALLQTSDQGYLITGVLDVTASGGEGNSNRSQQRHAGGDYWVIKTDPTGHLEWSRYFGGNFTDTPEQILPTADQGFIIAGGSDSSDTDISNNLGTYDFWVIRISGSGDLLWERSFGGSEIDEAFAMVPAPDGNFFVAGTTRSNDLMIGNNKGAADIWLIKISPDGELIWENTYGGSNFDTALDMKLASDGLLICGSSRSADGDLSQNKGQNDLWIMKLNFEGAMQWERSLGGTNIDFGYSACALNDGNIIAVGDTSSNDGDIPINKGFTDLLIVEIDD
jgi:hypothetical protein